MADGNRRVEMSFRIVLLGRFEVVPQGGTAIPFGRTKPGILLAYLALRPDRASQRDELIELLWPDVEPDAQDKLLNEFCGFGKE
jgi:DNA-binding SARP family transcriptional activator